MRSTMRAVGSSAPARTQGTVSTVAFILPELPDRKSLKLTGRNCRSSDPGTASRRRTLDMPLHLGGSAYRALIVEVSRVRSFFHVCRA